ncbi:MAG: PA2778 family cysteine peptidase, partial [Bdellovibrionales bacterium]|nr:PA2778 family cysteine peptidase [Bdellovibrionales bacterium]
MNHFLLVVVALLLGGCATATRQTDALMKNRAALPETSKLKELPLIKQARNHCGPATMAMMLNHAGKNVSLVELNQQMFTEKAEGTFQSDMLSTARYQGMLAIPINDMTSLLTEVSAGNPVVVFQNLGMSWWPKWHYAVVTGHDFRGPDILLHSGNDKYQKTDMRFFERTWILGERWGLLVLNPNQLSVTANERTHVAAAAMLEGIGKLDEAQTSYQTILLRWPQSLAALIGLGNVTYARKKFQSSIDYLKKAVTFYPESAIAWHNLATVQGEI